MKAEAKNTNIAIRLKEVLKPYGKPHILYACGASLGLIILILAYWPLATRLSEASNSLSKLQSELLSQRVAIAALESSNAKSRVIRQDEVSLAIAEITEKGRDLGLNFGSISPSQLHQTTQTGIQKLPISFMIESEYKNLGQFLAYIEELPCSVAEVEGMSIYPSEGSLPKLSVELVLNLYVEIENET